MQGGTDPGSARKRENVGRLFRLIDEHEKGGRPLDTEAFERLLGQVTDAHMSAGDEPTGAAANGLDRALHSAISMAPIDASDLRYVCSHFLAIHHHAIADGGRGFQDAYSWVENQRPERQPDLPFLRVYVLPRVTSAGAFRGNLRLARLFLETIGRFENLQGVPVWGDDDWQELLTHEPNDIAYQLARRRVQYGQQDMTGVSGTLEQRIHADGGLKRIVDEGGAGVALLAEVHQEYFPKKRPRFWAKVRHGFERVFGGLVERMAGEHVAYVMTKRGGAYFAQGFLILAILLCGVIGWALLDHFGNIELAGIRRDIEASKRMLTSEQENAVAVETAAARASKEAKERALESKGTEDSKADPAGGM